MQQANQLLDQAKVLRNGIDQCRQGNHKGAIESFNQALHLDPDDAEAHGHRCVAHYRLGDLPGAIADCQRAATLYLNQGKLKEHQYSLNMLQRLRG
ncbi:tetratricopeptide repeat protein [Oculatella sp. LEGE 06141]|uniref:tetratricopeptide repeat protein n=1 Tax=Oculatella sp. LEGE 06141 TaxID=1828648 RepID=UPI00187F868B|nr:tetratricopeptide repeat protein [Oculatella sp. LEGE 06141]MBE9182273.1 tetratricopeptide repeat protein [Oculatella sp. LEGE 06141]